LTFATHTFLGGGVVEYKRELSHSSVQDRVFPGVCRIPHPLNSPEFPNFSTLTLTVSHPPPA